MPRGAWLARLVARVKLAHTRGMLGTERGLIDGVLADPGAHGPRLVYADWLEDQGDPRAEFLRLELRLRSLQPDDAAWPAIESRLSRLRTMVKSEWISLLCGELWPTQDSCACLTILYDEFEDEFEDEDEESEDEDEDDEDEDDGPQYAPVELHRELQDTEAPGWKRLLELVDEAAADGRSEFRPRRDMTPEQWNQIVTLPASIAKLERVQTLNLYGSRLLRIPPEIGNMTSLEIFVPYTSYELHWFPYEITRCHALRDSTVSTRALYGNNNHRPPFPRLGPRPTLEHPRASPATRPCSVCDEPFEDRGLHRVWCSLPVATDVLPLLVNACSEACVSALPKPPEGYVAGPHRGGLELTQPRGR